MSIDDETLAKLILSVGTHKKVRPWAPITTAKELEKWLRISPLKEVARKLDVTTQTITMFTNLLTLPETEQKLVEDGKIGIDIGNRISRFPDPKDQVILSKALVDKQITAKEIKGSIKNFRNINPEMPILECIELAIKYRPIIEEEHVVISKIQASTLNSLKERAEAYGISINTLTHKLLKGPLPTEKGFISATVFDQSIVLTMTKEGRIAFKAEAAKSKIRLNDFIGKLIERQLTKQE